MGKNRRVVSLLLETLALLCFFLLPLLSFGVIRYVPGEYSSIQEAIDAATDGDEIIVSPGTYYENVYFGGKNIILRSTDPTSQTVVASTIIDGNQAGSVVMFSGTEYTTCVLSGFTITNGWDYYNGGGIYGNGSHATIRHNMISGNTTEHDGGGLAYCNGTIRNNLIFNNEANGPGGCGGGLFECNGIIQNNTISANFAYGHGGGIYDCDGTLQNDTISRNTTYYEGGGLYGCDGTIQNNIVSNNSAGKYGGGLYGCNATIQNNTICNNRAYWNGGGLNDCHGFVINCIIWGNSARFDKQTYECSLPFYSCIQDWTFGGRGNISADPRFNDPTNDDYHLRDDSPCIDAGNTYYLLGAYIVDIDGQCRIAGSSVDMGCYEYNSAPDSDGDLLTYLAELAQGSNPNNPDTDGDGLIDGIEALRGTDPTYYNIPPGILIPTEYPSIQQGIFLAFPSEVVTIDSGTYYENLHFLGKNVILESTNPLDEDIVNSTIVDGSALFSVVFFRGTENETSAIKGLTICSGIALSGGGIWGNGTKASIENNKILRNSGIGLYSHGAGLDRCDGIIENNTISDNFRVSSGGALHQCNGTIRGNTILGNSAICGGGVEGCEGAIQNNTILGNLANYGGGLYCCRDTIIQNNIISFNSAYYGGGLFGCGTTIENNTVSGNSASYYGGGLSECNGTIQNNIISGNSAYYGGGLSWCYATIRNNAVSGNSAYYGGGLADCSYIIENNIILGNSAQDDGGGVYNCSAAIQNNTITSNSASSGGGLYNDTYYAIIQKNIISANRATVSGGGICNCHNIIQDNIICSNAASCFGGGLFGCTEIQNNTIWDNSAQYGGGVYGSSGYIMNCIITRNENYGFYESEPEYFSVEVKYCDIYGNICGDYYDYDTATSYTGTEINELPEVHDCISAEPYLVDPGGGNFHLQPISPCIDAGGYIYGLDEDFEGDARPYDATAEPRGDGSDFDIGADEFSGAVTLRDFDFDLTEEGWGWLNIPLFTQPDFDYTPGYLILTAQDNTNTYGFWTSELDAVPVIAECLYRARWTVATEVSNPLAVPTMQLRVNSQNFQQADMLVVSSCGDGSYAPTPEGRTYEMYFLPPESCLGKSEDQDDLILSFDMLNFDPGDAPDGSLMLDSVVVDAIPLTALGTATFEKAWTFPTDAERWHFGSVPAFSAPLSNVSGGALWLIAQSNTNTFGFWSGPSDEVEMQAGKLYRLRFAVGTDVTDQERVPQLRLRASSEDFQSSIMKVISSVMGAEMSPTPTISIYDLYFYPPQTLVGTEADSILVAFDMLNFDPSDAADGALLLYSVLVESVGVP